MDLEAKQAEMRKRWSQIRPVISQPPAKRRTFRGHSVSPSRPFGTISLDAVCELKQIGKLAKDLTLPQTRNCLATMARAAKQHTQNEVMRNLCNEFLRGLGEQP